jgi:hypothetical protein
VEVEIILRSSNTRATRSREANQPRAHRLASRGVQFNRQLLAARGLSRLIEESMQRTSLGEVAESRVRRSNSLGAFMDWLGIFIMPIVSLAIVGILSGIAFIGICIYWLAKRGHNFSVVIGLRGS